ncbi:acetamidase, partial [Acinetobacter baumannii]
MLKVKCLTASVLSVLCISLTHANDFKVLNQISKQPTQLQTGEYKGNYYVPSTLYTI